MMFPKPLPRVREPKGLNQISAKRAARIAAGEERAGMKRSRLKVKPPRRLDGPGSDPGRLEYARAQMCVGLVCFPGHVCIGDVEASHERNPMGGLPTGMGRKEDDRLTTSKCGELHRQWTRAEGPFEGWSNERRHEWMAERIAETNAGWDELGPDQQDWWRGHAVVMAKRRAEARRAFA